MPIFIDEPQLSPEWFAIRAGIPSASKFSEIITITGKPAISRTRYMNTLAGEKILGRKEETYQSPQMERGVQMEEEARKYYSLITGNEVKTIGFCFQDKKKLWGCSCDGLINDDGILEIKCKNISNHITYILNGKLISPEFQQVQGQLLITGRKWVDFLCYYPGLRHSLLRVERDETFIKALEAQLKAFVRELRETIKKLK